MVFRNKIKALEPLHYSAILAALISAGIHLYLAPQIGVNTLGLSFVLAGTGFLLGIIAFIYDYRRRLVCILGIFFTAGQIAIWHYMNRVPLESLLRAEPLLDFLDKTAQVLLIIILIVLVFKE